MEKVTRPSEKLVKSSLYMVKDEAASSRIGNEAPGLGLKPRSMSKEDFKQG